MYCQHCKADKEIKQPILLRQGTGYILECTHLISPNMVAKLARPDEEVKEVVRCIECKQDRLVVKKVLTDNVVYRTFSCGHESGEVPVRRTSVRPLSEESEKPVDLTTLPTAKPARERDERWNDLYPFQRTGIEFSENAKFSFVNGDDMGLGKTIQTIMLARYNRDAMLPLLVLVPAQLVYQWQRAFKDWFCDKYTGFENAPFIHFNGRGNLLRGLGIIIMSRSLVINDAVLDEVKNYGFKTVVVDESQGIKSDNSSLTKAVKQICQGVPNRIMLSGKSIMNRVMDYYNPLYIVRPEKWSSRDYLAYYCAKDRKGRLLGISQHKQRMFFDATNEYVLRRTKAEVLKDLPPKRVEYNMYSLNSSSSFVQAYNKKLDELEEIINTVNNKAQQANQILVLMTQLRHLVGLSKITTVAERAIQIVQASKAKLTIGVHHKLVLDQLSYILQYRICPDCKYPEFNNAVDDCEDCGSDIRQCKIVKSIRISDEDPRIKDDRCKTFAEDSENYIMVASILGCGIGRNLQFCHQALIAEREWNHAIEVQFEDRFYRIGTTDTVEIEYVNAAETIDEFFHELVTLKGQVSASGLDKGFVVNNDLMRKIADLTLRKRLKYVG